MSANQIPPPFPKSQGSKIGHSCPRCWSNGGGGHIPAELLRIARKDGDVIATMPVNPGSKITCRYWSAKKLEYCESTDRVTSSGPTWSRRCAMHAITTTPKGPTR